MVLYRGFIFFPIFIHVLVSLVHFIHVLVLLVHVLLLLIHCIVDIWLLFSMIDIIPMGINLYVIPMIPLCGNP